jgi:hypothetical protein
MGDGKREIDRHTIYAALVVALGVGLYWWMFYQAGFSSGRREERAHVEREHYAADAANKLGNVCNGMSGAAAAKCGYQVAETEREGRRNESDLAAQWKAADWVFWAGIIGGAQLFVTAVGLFFIKRTLDANWGAMEAAQDSLSHQRETAQLQLRPYLYIGDEAKLELPLTLKSRIRLKVKNYGLSPAFNLKLGTAHVLVKRPIRDSARNLAVTEFADLVSVLGPQAEMTVNMILADLGEGTLELIRNGTAALIGIHAIKYEGTNGVEDCHEISIYVDKNTCLSGEVLTLNEWARQHSHEEPSASPELNLTGGK